LHDKPQIPISKEAREEAEQKLHLLEEKPVKATMFSSQSIIYELSIYNKLTLSSVLFINVFSQLELNFKDLLAKVKFVYRRDVAHVHSFQINNPKGVLSSLRLNRTLLFSKMMIIHTFGIKTTSVKFVITPPLL